VVLPLPSEPERTEFIVTVNKLGYNSTEKRFACTKKEQELKLQKTNNNCITRPVFVFLKKKGLEK